LKENNNNNNKNQNAEELKSKEDLQSSLMPEGEDKNILENV